jgi:hypothetical protein
VLADFGFARARGLRVAAGVFADARSRIAAGPAVFDLNDARRVVGASILGAALLFGLAATAALLERIHVVDQPARGRAQHQCAQNETRRPHHDPFRLAQLEIRHFRSARSMPGLLGGALTRCADQID